MKINIIKSSFLILLITIAFSCKENLQLEPISEISVASFWKTPDDAQGALNGMYARFRNQTQQNIFLWGGARSELLELGQQASETLERYFLNLIDATFTGPDWSGLYTSMHDVNSILFFVPEIEFSNNDQKNEILAQAYAMRAYLYFIMGRTWGEVPLVLEPSLSFESERIYIPKNSEAEIFAQIKSDIEMALQLFPNDNFNDRIMWNKAAVNALKGEVHLWTAKRLGGGSSDLNTALAALQAVPDVGLLDNFDDIFRSSNKGNDEVLMAIRYLELEEGNNYNQRFYLVSLPSNPDPKSVEAIGTLGGLSRLAPSEEIRKQFDPLDSRRDATFIEVWDIDPSTGDSTYYEAAMTKYRGFTNDGGSRVFRDDIILYRYADVLLMIAEAKNALGQDPTEEMNRIRARGYAENYDAAIHGFVNGSQEANDDAILKERLFELAFESKRWYDLVRFGKAFELVPSLRDRASQSHLVYFPISTGTISDNPQITQVSGY